MKQSQVYRKFDAKRNPTHPPMIHLQVANSCSITLDLMYIFVSFFNPKIHLWTFRERVRCAGEEWRERNVGQLSHICATSENLTYNPVMCPDWELNWWLLALWDDTHPSEPYWSGQEYFLNFWKFKSIFRAMKLLCMML